MNRVMVLARKEFRGYFTSWVAYFFIALFVLVSLLLFFFQAEFFAVGRAELRGLFAWFPLTLALLVPGLTMRQWAREREMGSIELLLTLPAKSGELVVGKFLGSTALVAVALAFTLGAPITAACLGDLDTGPVIGGYVAALLLGAAYVAIGLFVSSWFSDQFVALVTGWVVCLFLAALSNPDVLSALAGWPEWALETLSFLGFWSRFEAIERGVLDLRDVGWYVSVTALFLFLNAQRLRLQRWA